MNRNLLLCIALLLTSMRALADYADSVWLDYQEGLTTSGDVIMTDIRVEETTLYTYYAGLVWNNGYMGLQRGGGSYFKHVHFSLWDPAHGGVADLVWAADDVVTERFGGEGTGWKAMWPFDWEEDITYRLCVALVHTDSATDYMAFFWDPAAGEWKHLATFRRSDDLHSFSYVASFVEDFGNTFDNRRSCLLGNAWLRTFDSNWIDLRTARYSSGGSKLNKDADLVGDMFRLETGGDSVNDTPAGTLLTRSPATTAPAVPVRAQFNYAIEAGSITITGYTGAGGDVVIPDTIDGLPVTAIGAGAFRDHTDIYSVAIPDTVWFIGGYTFAGCSGLAGITIPEGVSSIGIGVFDQCSSLTAITVDALNPVYSSLDGVLFDKSQTTLIEYPWGRAGSYSIPDSVTVIGDGAFHNRPGLTDITIGDGVTSIARAFIGCTGLTSFTLGKSLTRIDNEAFQFCTSLRTVSIPDSITRIGAWAFQGCTGLTSVSIGDNVTFIGAAAFEYCASLSSISIGNRVGRIEERAFNRCSGLTSVTIPDSVTHIGNAAFYLCTSLTTVRIGKGVTSIGWEAFMGCTSLTSVYFEGDAPVLGDRGQYDDTVFYGTSATIYYRQGAAGWERYFGDRPTLPWSLTRGDVDGDGEIDRDDLDVIVAARNTAALGPEDPRDLDGDGNISVLDARILVTLFTVPAGFTRIASSPEGVVVEWNENAGAMKLQGTTDLLRGTWQDVGGLQSPTNAVIGPSAESMFLRLVLPE